MAVAVIVVFTVAGTLYLQGNLADSTHGELREETDVVAAALNQANDDHVLLDKIELGDTRVTLVADDGTVLYDSDESPADMANHADRPEIAEALADGDGISERSSSTMGETMLYNAGRLDDGSLLRTVSELHGSAHAVLLSNTVFCSPAQAGQIVVFLQYFTCSVVGLAVISFALLAAAA